MAEPDNKMDGPLWPEDWQTGWVSGRYVDAVGNPLTGSLILKLSVKRASSVATHTTIYGGERNIPIVGGLPSGPHVTVNAAGVPCVEFPITTDPDIQPTGIQLLVTESWSGQTFRHELTAAHTLENPLWMSGTLTELVAQTGVIQGTIWDVALETTGIPSAAKVGDWVFYANSGRLTKITSI